MPQMDEFLLIHFTTGAFLFGSELVHVPPLCLAEVVASVSSENTSEHLQELLHACNMISSGSDSAIYPIFNYYHIK